MSYTCDRCMADFKNKTAFTRHKERKIPCKPVAEKIDQAQTKVLQTVGTPGAKIKQEMLQARNILRRAGIHGLEALNCITAILVLRELDDIYGEKLADKKCFAPAPRLGKLTYEATLESKETRFSVLAAMPFDNDEVRNYSNSIRNAFTTLTGHIGEVGERLKGIDFSTRMFTLNDSRVTYDLIKFCQKSLKFDGADTLGGGYSSIVKDLLEGKELGQFFTDHKVVKYAVGEVMADRKIGTLLDPTCGSGGFLSVVKDADAIVGYEIDPRVALLAYAHCLIVHRKLPEIRRMDFLREAPNTQYDTILANPPFGVKGIKHKDIIESKELNGDGAESYPLNSSATGFFLQRIIHVLKVGGRAAIVLPLGKEMSSGGAAEIKMRQAMLKACRFLKIVAIPSGMFENTSIKTALIVFEKVCELSECLKKKGKSRITVEVDANVPDATTELTFAIMQADGSVLAPTESKECVTLEDIKARNYSLSPDDYKHKMQASEFSGTATMVKLGDICKMQAGKFNSKDKLATGKYPFFNASNKNPCGFGNVASFTYNEYIIFVKDGGNSKDNTSDVGMGKTWLMREPSCATSHVLALHGFADTVHVPFIHIYMNGTAEETRIQCARFTTGLGMISMERLRELMIPLPPFDVQVAIASELDTLAAGIEYTKRAAEHYERKMRVLLQCAVGDPNIPKAKLGDICKMRIGGKYNAKDAKTEGKYPLFSAATKNPCGFENVASINYPEYIVLVKVGGNSKDNTTNVGLGKAWYMNTPCCSTAATFALYNFRSDINVRFVQTYLSITPERTREKTAVFCTGLGNISMERLRDLEIPLPPIEMQKEIVLKLNALSVTLMALRVDEDETRALMRDRLRMMLSLPPDAEEKDDSVRNIGDRADEKKAPNDEAPAEEVPADEAPAEEVPADEAPADEAPADEAPADEAPANEAPADEASADEAPANAMAMTVSDEDMDALLG